MIDLGKVKGLLSDARLLAEDLDNIEMDDSQSITVKRKVAAEATRDLLYLADQLAMGSQLVREQYWGVKGYSKFVD